MYVVKFSNGKMSMSYHSLELAQDIVLMMGGQVYELTDPARTTRIEQTVPLLRCLMYRLTETHSPVSEGEMEEIARCALRGGYKLDLDALDEAQAAFQRGDHLNDD